MMLALESHVLSRPSGHYLVEGFQLVDQRSRVVFPSNPDVVPAVRGRTLDVVAFATRAMEPSLWCDFRHPETGRWLSMLVCSEWVGGESAPPTIDEGPLKRGPFKRPR